MFSLIFVKLILMKLVKLKLLLLIVMYQNCFVFW